MTPNQISTLQAAIAADPALDAKPRTSAGAYEIKQALNAPSSPPVMAWRTNVPVSEIVNAMSWDKFTPTDGPPVLTNPATLTDVCNLLAQITRTLTILTKQINLNTVFAVAAAEGRLDFSKANVRGAIQDAVLRIPSAAGGDKVNVAGAGGAGVLTMGTRVCTRAEAILASAEEVTGPVTAKILTFEGDLSVPDIRKVRP